MSCFLKVGDIVEVIDKYDMNFGCIGIVSCLDKEWDKPEEGVFIVKVRFKFVEVPYEIKQLKKIESDELREDVLCR